MLIRQLRPWRPLVPVKSSGRPRIFPHPLPRALVCAKRFSHDERRIKVSQASVLFENSRHATSDNLIASIEPISLPGSIEGIEDSFEQAILLFTPRFATSLAYDPQFLPKVLNRLFEKLPDFYQDGPGSNHLNVAVAVVDCLPRPCTRIREYTNRPPLSDHGSEGMSYVVSTISELRVASDTLPLTNPNLDETKTLSLRVGNASDIKAVGMLDSEKYMPPANTLNADGVPKQHLEVRIPLASTVFQTGQPGILSLSSWAWRKAEDRYLLEQQSTESPNHVSFQYPFVRALSIKIPLVPLTPPRKIVASMGNVIRQIERDEEYITASQELEPAVSSYFIAKDLPPSAVNVWALVFPAARYLEMESVIHTSRDFPWLRTGSNSMTAQDFDRLWHKPRAFERFHKWSLLVHRGIRLHRVLSGGGGWGKKAGLISLDPDSDFKEPPVAELGAMFANSDLFETNEGMLGNAAKVGDLVQFYICPSNTAAPLPPDMERGMRLEIGIIPSTVDNIPLTEESNDDTGALHLGRVHHHQFGFMSEKGISIATLKQGSDLSWTTSSRTKISVPFSRLVSGRSTRSLLFTSTQGKITPFETEQLPSEPIKISPLDSLHSRKTEITAIETERIPSGQHKLRQLDSLQSGAMYPAFRPLQSGAVLRASRKLKRWATLRELRKQQLEAKQMAKPEEAEESSQHYTVRRRAERLVKLRSQLALPSDFDNAGFIDDGSIITKHSGSLDPSSSGQRIWLNKKEIPKTRAYTFAEKIKLRFPDLRWQKIKGMMVSYFRGTMDKDQRARLQTIHASRDYGWPEIFAEKIKLRFPDLKWQQIKGMMGSYFRGTMDKDKWATLQTIHASVVRDLVTAEQTFVRKVIVPPKSASPLTVRRVRRTRAHSRQRALRATQNLSEAQKQDYRQSKNERVIRLEKRDRWHYENFRKRRAKQTSQWADWKLRKQESGTRFPVYRHTVLHRKVPDGAKASWNLLHTRRRRGRREVKMRNRYEEGLETALIRKHLRMDPIGEGEASSWDTVWLGGKGGDAVKKVETLEMKAKRREKEEKEKEELLDTVKELLKGF